MKQLLPSERGLWGKLVQGVQSVFSPTIYAAEIISSTQAITTEKTLKSASDRDQKRAELAKIKLMLQEVQHRENIEFQREEGEINRNFQLQLAKFNREFLSQQSTLDREHSEKIETFRANVQRWAIDQQKDLQLELKRMDMELAQLERIASREGAIEVIKEQKREHNSPIWLLAEDLISAPIHGELTPLRILFAPPTITQDREMENNGNVRLPEMEKSLARELRKFFELYSSQGRPVEFLAGAWTSKFFHSEAAVKAVFRGLKTEPFIILEAVVEGETFDLNFAFWGMNWHSYRYKTAISLSWKEALYDFAKMRTLEWFKRQKKFSHDRSQLDEIYGEGVVNNYFNNINIYKRERICLESGGDPTDIERDYYLSNKDYEELRKFLAICHCLFAGILADEYFLVHVLPEYRKQPLLPEILWSLLSGMPESVIDELVELVISSYETIYQAIAQEESAWLPELQLDLAKILIKLDKQTEAQGKVQESIISWLNLHQIPIVKGDSLLSIITEEVSINDRAYVDSLNQCLQLLGDEGNIHIPQSCHSRGIKYLNNQELLPAINEFTMAITLDENCAESYYYRAIAYHHLEEYSLAIADFNQSIKINPQYISAYQELGKTAEKIGNYDLALANYDLAIKHGIHSVSITRDQLLQKLQHIKTENYRSEYQGTSFTFTPVIVDSNGIVQPTSPQENRLIVEKLSTDVNLTMIYVPDGQFIMGSSNNLERPQHRVHLSSFHIGKYPITQLQWRIVCETVPAIDLELNPRPAYFVGDDLPIENINWYQAKEFCKRLSKLTGKTYRLPSESEWEYSCRAGTHTLYNCGDKLTIEVANFNMGSLADAVNGGQQKTNPVGMFPPNPWGIHDLHGNVWEWCEDIWHENYLNAPNDGAPWVDGGKNDHRVLRGGSWFNNAWNCRTTNRNWVKPDIQSWLYGFRVVLIVNS
jgi:formylglycine-generating enzyme required for sulfatase activity